MVKPAGSGVDRLVTSPPDDLQVFVLFGPDTGLVRERASVLAGGLIADPDDPFAVSRLSDEDLKADPAALADAMAALSLGGGHRLVRVRLTGDSALVAGWIAEFEAGNAPAEARLIVEAGNLAKGSTLRKVAEDGRRSAALACYADNPRDLIEMAEASLKAEGLSLSPAARPLLAQLLEGDRQLARSEIEKLIIYKGPNGSEITPEDISDISTSGAETALDNVIEPALSGNPGETDRNYQRALESGLNPVAIVRALQRKIDQIDAFHTAGNDPSALARSGAPRFGPPAQRFQAMARQWNPSRLARARQIAFDTERALKRSGAPAEALTGETLLRLARAASATR